MNPIKCKLILNTASGRCTEPEEFPSIASAVAYAKGSCYFAYRIYDGDDRLVARGYC